MQLVSGSTFVSVRVVSVIRGYGFCDHEAHYSHEQTRISKLSRSIRKTEICSNIASSELCF
jgi:hypothetical protein